MAVAIPAARGSHDDGDRNTIPGGCGRMWVPQMVDAPCALKNVFEVLFSCGKC